MIAGTGFEKNKPEPTRFPRGIRRSRPDHEIDRYVYVYSSVGGFVSRIYRRILRKSEGKLDHTPCLRCRLSVNR